MNLHWSRLYLAALCALLISCSGNGRNESEGFVTPEGSRATEVVEDLGALVDVIVAKAKELPRAEFDPATLAAKLGKDPQAHFEWVRDHTWWAPYRGLLRGPQGVMLDRVGSSLDRAVLLGDILRRSGHRVRLARSELPVSRARELLTRVRPMPASRLVLPASPTSTASRDHGREAALPGGSKELPAQIAASKESYNRAAALVQSQAEMLLAALRDATKAAQSSEAKSLAALQDHWWVEYEADGKWNALDVLLPDAKAGDTYASASATSEWNSTESAPSIPASYWHRVGLKVVIERYEAGATKESTVLATTIRPAETLDKLIALVHIPMPWPDDVPFPGANLEAIRTATLQVVKWVPVLHIGSDQFVQAAFTNMGELEEPLTGPTSLLGTGQTMSEMDMALGGFGEETATVATTAEWIDYELHVPGEAIQRFRRPVFDLLGPGRRSAGSADFVTGDELSMVERAEALLSQTEILLQPCDFTGAFVAHLKSAGIISNQSAIKELANESDPQQARTKASAILERIDIWGPLLGYVRWRSALGGHSQDWFIDRPNLLSYRISQPLQGVERIALREQMDVVSNGIGFRSSAGRTALEIRVRQGVTDTVAEMLALGNALEASANAASVFNRLVSTGSRGFFIAAGDDAAVGQLPWPDDEVERVAADVKSGYLVFVPRQAVEIDGEPHVAWWRVNPTSGETIGVMDTGWHGDDVEYPLMNAYTRKELTQAKMRNYPRWQNLRNQHRDNPYSLTPDQSWEIRFANEIDRTLEHMIGLGL